jgi:hypothetical protein
LQSEPIVNRADRNLIFWKSLVGLEATFPALAPLRDQELLPLVVTDPTQLSAIQTSLASHQLTQIVVEPGWGRTTLFRYLLKDARDNAMGRLLLPLAIDLETLFQREALTSDALQAELKQQIVGLLIDIPWEQSLPHDYYFECINYDAATDVASYKARMRLFLTDRPPTTRQLLGQFPWLRATLSSLLNYLLANLRIQTALYIHFPDPLDSQRLRDLVGAIKVGNEAGPLDYAAWREVYFCGQLQQAELGRDYVRPFNVLEYPRYTAAQIYAMLVKRYTPNLPGYRARSQVTLGSVFDEAFVHQAWRGVGSLGEVVERVRAAMLRRLDCPEVAVPFQLAPLEEATVADQETGMPTARPPRRRFERQRRTG